ncbi:Fn3-like domain-containing protein [Georgenia satyanarayanai]|uniref:Fn3-like domain-containing protein n=1 Tax=Georgenia satyanarayanai TaxID=860221 RepID=A0A2Y9A374_9MICO|nr:S8 family serine peptidase [Georgenia satyanarayanai]PYG01817.1 Fn3 domain-containing protein [Georgenia satyanarayanai]SSA36617.1 Fn3-like domain-containing protein [Georgenia satyanarayanai]
MAALALTLAAPAAVADEGTEFLGTASDLGVQTPSADAELTSEFVSSPTGAWFVELDPTPASKGGSTARIERAQRSFVAEAQSAGVELEVRHEFSTLWSGVSADIDDEDIDKVTDLPQVRAVYPVLPVAAPERPVSEPELWSALSMTGADIAQSELGFDGEGIRVGIIDTGVDYDHPDLGGSGVDGETDFPSDKVVAGYDFVGDDYNSDPESDAYQPLPMPDADPDDCNGHGTHVAGIVGADGDVLNEGVRGVAPGVELGAYRVFGCDGSTESDIMVAAMERALADGMDVVNQSIGAAFSTWPQYPTAVASDNLVDAGVVMVASIGNSGASGTWSAGAPGVGEDVIGVASFDNVSVTASVVEIDGEEHPYFPATGAPEPPTEGSLPLTRLGDPGTAEARACVGDSIEADLDGHAVLIERGAHESNPDCDASFYAKAYKAQQAGAAAVVIYNNVPGVINPTVAGTPPITIPVIAISQASGIAADAAVVDDGATLTWTEEIGTAPNPTAGLISDFSSYGLAADLTLKPDLGAPGGSIYSTYPLEEGEYATISGTSMSAPHVAGAAALLLEARPDTGAHDVRDLLLNSADPATWSGVPNQGYTEPVHRQGAGMLDIDDAILSTATVTPGKLSLGESEQGAVTRELTVTNDGGEDVTYELSSTDAIATADDPDDPGFYDGAASVVMPDELTVPAGGEASFEVAISPAEDLEQAQYGGYLVLTPDEGEPLSVPFAGFAGDYQAQPLLENLGDLDLPALGQLVECDRLIGVDCAAGGSWNLADGGTVFTLDDGDVPTVLLHLEHPVQSLTFTIYRPVPEAASTQAVERQAIARYEEYVGRDSGTFTAWTWDGSRSTSGDGRSAVPDGHYVLEVEALSALGDADNPDHVQTWSTPSFVVDRDGDGEVPPLEPEQPQPGPQRYGFYLNDGWDGEPEHVFQYGRHTDEVLIGDWDGDGTDTITVRRENRFHVNNAPRGGDADRVFTYGRPGDVVLVGDWDGEGTDTLAVRRGSTYHVKNSLRGGEPDHVITYGRVDDAVMVGDWDGDGTDTFAVRRGSTYHVKNSMRGGDADRTFTYGREADVTLAGDWDANGTDTFAVRRGNAYFVKNSLAGGDADFSVRFGRESDEVLVGDWNGDGRDTLGVRRTPLETAEPTG